MVGGTAQPFHPIGDSNTDAFQSLCLHTFSGQHPDATGIARDSLSLTGPSLLSRATRPCLLANRYRDKEYSFVFVTFKIADPVLVRTKFVKPGDTSGIGIAQ